MNTLKMIIDNSKYAPYQVSEKINLSRSYIYQLIKGDDIPRGTKLETLDRIAEELGYTVKVEFVKVGE